MKWFKHDADASNDAKIKKLILKHGAEGYAIYFHCIELIANGINDHNITFELEHDAEIIADNLKIKGDSGLSAIDKVNNIMKTIINLCLFEDSNKTITCFKLAKRIDQSMTSNPKMREIIKKIKNHDKIMINHDSVMGSSDKIMQDKISIAENRIDKIRKDKKKTEKKKSSSDSNFLNEVLVYWNSKKTKVHRNILTVEKYLLKKEISDLKTIPLEDIKRSIDNYLIVLRNPKYYWTWEYNLWDFIKKGIYRFSDSSFNFKDFLDNTKKQSTPIDLKNNEKYQEKVKFRINEFKKIIKQTTDWLSEELKKESFQKVLINYFTYSTIDKRYEIDLPDCKKYLEKGLLIKKGKKYFLNSDLMSYKRLIAKEIKLEVVKEMEKGSK